MTKCQTCEQGYQPEPHCPDCHHTWSDSGNYNHCVRCHETFQSESSADKHELYDRSDDEIYCCSPEDRGLVWKPDVGGGVWGLPPSDAMEGWLAAKKG